MRVLARFRLLAKDESGQAMVLSGVGFIVIIAFLSLAIDVGQLRYQQTKLQNAADAAALAGALEISTCGTTHACTTMKTAVTQALTENGFSGSTAYTNCGTPGSGLTVVVNQGPCQLGSTSSDPNYGNAQYVEVVVSYPQPTYFARIVGVTSVNITVRSEAGLGNNPFCLYLSGTSGVTLETNSNSSLSLSCGVMVNSSGSPAAQADSGSSISATTIHVHGTTASFKGATFSPSPVTNSPTLSDPLSWVTPPSVGNCTYNNTSVSGTASLSPGTYCGGISTSKNSTVTFQSGVYIVEGGMAINDGVSVTGTGVTFYIYSGAVQFNKTSSADLVAPTTGQYAGILMFQNTSDTSTAALNAGSTGALQGALYFPDAQLQLNGSNTAAYTIVDAQSLQLDSNSTFSIGNDYSSLPGGSPAKGGVATLVE